MAIDFDPKAFLLEHGEKVALGAAGLILLSALVTQLAADSPAKTNKASVDRAMSEIDRLKREGNERKWKWDPPAALASAKKEFGDGVPIGDQLKPWLLEKRPYADVKVKDKGEVPPVKHRPPTDLAAAATRGKVTLTWRKAEGNAYVKWTYKVWRKEVKAPDAQWAQVGSAGQEAQLYEDPDVRPKTTYWYRLTSEAVLDGDAAAVKQYNKPNEPPLMRVEDADRTCAVEMAEPVVTPPDLYVRVLDVTVPTIEELAKDPKLTAWCYLKVYKYSAEEQKWYDFAYNQLKEGAALGDKQRVGSKEIDFGTGYTIVAIEVREREKKIGAEVTKERLGVVRLKDKDTGAVVEINNLDIPAEILEIERPKGRPPAGGTGPGPSKPPKPPGTGR